MDSKKFFPTKEHIKYMRFCHNNNVVFLSLEKVSFDIDKYYLVSIDKNNFNNIKYFLINNLRPQTPSNKKQFSEYEAYEMMFRVYKKKYFERNLTERDNFEKEESAKKEEELHKIQLSKKKTKKQSSRKTQKKDMLNFPFKQIDLLDMIEECEKEDEEKI